MVGDRHRQYLPEEDSLPGDIALTIDDDVPMEAAREEYESNYERPFLDSASRTLFHTPRDDEDTVNSTRSLYDYDIPYTTLYHRRYCKDYYMPNDEEEQTRTQILHGVFLFMLDQKLTTVPLDNPQKILDIGTGTGEWAMAMGDEYPDTEIIGTDIAKIQPTAAPLNVFFEIDDAEEEGGWMWDEDEFDFIHCRSMQGAFKDWKYIYMEAFHHLKPGGWIEIIDFDDHQALLSYFKDYPVVIEWLHTVLEASILAGRPRTALHLEPERLTELGFVDAKTTSKTIPIGIWPDDPMAQQIGKQFLVTQLSGIEGVSLRLLVETMGWQLEDAVKLVEAAVNATRRVALDSENSRGIGFKVKILVGRKPDGTDTDSSSTKTVTNMNDETISGT
ncbi:Secondary metabolism regulator [Lachnellula willkommii]|uniref:Secondary metabolism regulator n=1 Tax=Lachnellula willkommii TaxID=215461 RepID=A0A559MLJ8_9HELO|nr:Secondary metabolism regulator [Lachnellula willkommii]